VKAVAALATLLLTALLTVSEVGSAQAAEGETWVILYADKEKATSAYTPGQATSRADIQATVSRTGTGSYTARLVDAGASGMPIVTAANSDGVHCQLASFSRSGADELVRVACYDRNVLTDSEFTLSFFASTPPDSGAAGAYGYVLDDQPTLATYVNPSTRYNSTGGRIEIYRSTQDPRIWTARFFGQSFNNTAGNVQVSAFGTRPARCGIVQWYPHSLGADAQIRCDNLSGVSSFVPQWTMTYTHDRSIVGGSTGFFGYLQANQPSTDSYTPPPPRNRAPNGLTHTVSRGAVGRYQAQIYGPLKEPVGAHVTVNGNTDKYCTLLRWAVVPTTQPAALVDINCYTAAGEPADAWFSLNYYSP
jgi:hypothetical protein